MKHTIARILVSGGAAASILFSGVAAAIDWNITGIVRQEIAVSISGDTNRNNIFESQWNDRLNQHATHNTVNFNNSITGTSTYANPNSGALGVFLQLNGIGAHDGMNWAPGSAGLAAGGFTSSPVGCRLGRERAIAAGATGFNFGAGPSNTFLGTLCQTESGALVGTNNNQAFFGANQGTNVVPGTVVPGTVPLSPTDPMWAQLNDQYNYEDKPNFNTFNTRAELDIQARFNRNWAAYMKLRIFTEQADFFSDSELYGHNFRLGKPSNGFWHGNAGQISEWNSNDVLVDIPAFYVDWQDGPLWIRAGNQVIAWGEAYFFRVMDVANGLDLRRHSVFTPGAEEYADQRVASPGIRLSYTFNNGWEIDAFAQMWSPTLLGGQNTPYNLVPFSIYVDDEIGGDDAKGAINFGAKLTMPFNDQLTGILGYVNRRNPDGIVTGAEAPTTWRGVANPFCLGSHNDTNNLLRNIGVDPTAFGLPSMPSLQGAGRVSKQCGTSFAPDPYTANAQEYYDNLATGRIDGAHYLTTQINEFPASQWATREIFGFGNEVTAADSMRTIEGFRSNFGGITQWVTRQFKREDIFLFGGNYITRADDPASFWDSIIIRGEVQWTPDKRFTNNLSFSPLEEDDIVAALIFEKYHRFSNAFPATYMVAQWMYRENSDMLGRNLRFNDPPTYSDYVDPNTGQFTQLALTPGGQRPEGNDNANYVVFAFQQPFPNLVWRFDMSILVDTAGGYLVQPGVRYRPAANWQWDLYATVIESPGGDNDTITETLDWADEFFVRLTYFF